MLGLNLIKWANILLLKVCLCYYLKKSITYMESVRYDQIYKHEADYWWFRGRRKLLKEIFKSIPPKKTPLKILDTGCCTGYNLHLLSEFGEIYGVDTEKKAVEYCKMRGFKKVFLLKNGLKLPFKNNYFDVVTCLDVLEHIKEDEDYLKELHRVLAPGGKLVLFTPAISLLWSQLDVISHHIRRYNKLMLSRKARKAKFVIKDIKYFNYILFLPILFIIMLQKIPIFKGKELGANLVVNNRLINIILFFIFYFDVWSVKWLSPPMGVSLLLIAEK